MTAPWMTPFLYSILRTVCRRCFQKRGHSYTALRTWDRICPSSAPWRSMHKWASIMASAAPSASVPGTSTSAPEARGVGGPRRHAAWPTVAATVSAALRSAVQLAASHDHACTKTNVRHVPPRHLGQSCETCWNLTAIVQGAKKAMGACSAVMRSGHKWPTR